MSKKKNTLKDLDEFLKQQAATLVTPAPLSTSDTPKETPIATAAVHEAISPDKILNDLKALSASEGPSFRKQFYDLIIHTVESHKTSSPEDKMLINTALYLKSGSNWKNAIKEYWAGR